MRTNNVLWVSDYLKEKNKVRYREIQLLLSSPPFPSHHARPCSGILFSHIPSHFHQFSTQKRTFNAECQTTQTISKHLFRVLFEAGPFENDM